MQRPEPYTAVRILSAHPGFAGLDDGVCPVCDLQLGEDVGDVVADGLGLRKSRPAILALEWPWAMSSRISTSRTLSSGKMSSREAGLGSEKKSMRRRAISGPKWASPAATARTTLRISEGGAP